MKLTQIVKNKVLIYLVSRYATYGLQFITSIIIASNLGPYYMGIWGFVLLILNYFGQFHFGIANSLNVLLVQNKDDESSSRLFSGNSFFLITILSIIVLLFYVYYLLFGIEIVDDYHASRYILPVCMIAIFQYYNGFFVNIFRVKNKLNSITVTQSLVVLFPFLISLFFKESSLVDALVFSYFFSNIFCVIYSYLTGVVSFPTKGEISKKYMSIILKKGILLFIYNSCFSFIIISIRTIVSDSYPIKDFGYFTLAFTLGNAIMMLLDAISFIIFPKVLSLFNSDEVELLKRRLKDMRTIYMTSAHILVYIFIFSMPLLLKLIPEYSNSLQAFNFISLALLMKANMFGHSSLLIAKNKEAKASIISAVGLFTNVVVGIFLVRIVDVPFSYAVIATLISYFVMTSWFYMEGTKIIGDSVSIRSFIQDYFPISLLIPYISSILIVMLNFNDLLFVPFVMAILFNVKGLIDIYKFSKKIVRSPSIVNV